MNAIELLKEDHDVVAELFDQVKAAPPSKHPALCKKIDAELEVHTHIEETVFYPKLKKDGKKDVVDITMEGIEEHRQIKMFLKELGKMSGRGDAFEAKLKVLIEDVEHHVKEEEDEMFPMVEDQFSPLALEKLGVALAAKKKSFSISHPAIAKNLVRRGKMGTKGTLETIYDKAMTAVEGIFTGTNENDTVARTSNKKTGHRSTSTLTRAGANENGRTAKQASRAKTAATAKKATSKIGTSARASKPAAAKSRSSISSSRGGAAK